MINPLVSQPDICTLNGFLDKIEAGSLLKSGYIQSILVYHSELVTPALMSKEGASKAQAFARIGMIRASYASNLQGTGVWFQLYYKLEAAASIDLSAGTRVLLGYERAGIPGSGRLASVVHSVPEFIYAPIAHDHTWAASRAPLIRLASKVADRFDTAVRQATVEEAIAEHVAVHCSEQQRGFAETANKLSEVLRELNIPGSRLDAAKMKFLQRAMENRTGPVDTTDIFQAMFLDKAMTSYNEQLINRYEAMLDSLAPLATHIDLPGLSEKPF